MYSKGRVRNRIIKHLGPVRKRSDIDRYRKEFLLYSKKQELEEINLESLKISNALEFGFYYATRYILNRTGIGSILEYHLGDCAELTRFLIACSIAMPSRRQPLSEVLSNTYYPWLGHTSRDQVFKTLDSLVKHKEGIESDVFREIRPATSEVTCFVVSSRFTTSLDTRRPNLSNRTSLTLYNLSRNSQSLSQTVQYTGNLPSIAMQIICPLTLS